MEFASLSEQLGPKSRRHPCATRLAILLYAKLTCYAAAVSPNQLLLSSGDTGIQERTKRVNESANSIYSDTKIHASA